MIGAKAVGAQVAAGITCADCGKTLTGDAVWEQCSCGSWERLARFDVDADQVPPESPSEVT